MTGTGVSAFDVDYSIDGGGWIPWLVHTSWLSATFSPTGGHAYSFIARAYDQAGNKSDYSLPVSIYVTKFKLYLPSIMRDYINDTIPPTSTIMPFGVFTYTGPSIPVSWMGVDNVGGSGVVSYDILYRIDSGTWITWLAHTPLTTSQFIFSQRGFVAGTDHTYDFYSRAYDKNMNVETGDPSPKASLHVRDCLGDLYEPNDSPTQRPDLLLSAGQALVSYICGPSPSSDYYWINLPTSSILRIDMPVPPNNDYDLFLYKSGDPNAVAYSSHPMGITEIITYTAPTPGVYFVQVYPYQNSFNNVSPYTLTAHYDNYEPNDTFQQAFGPLISGMSYDSFIASSIDTYDYYNLTTTVPASITIDLTNIPVGTDYDLFLYSDSDHANSIAYSSHTGNTPEHINYFAAHRESTSFWCTTLREVA